MNYILTIADGQAEEFYILPEGASTIGRESDNVIQIFHETISRYHAKIYNLPNSCEIEDLNSTNGTFVGGLKIKKASLQNQDEIKLGDVRLRLDQLDYEAESKTDTARDYSNRSQQSTVKIKIHPLANDEIEIKSKSETTYIPPLRLKTKS